MISDEDLLILKDAASQAAAATMLRPEQDLRTALFPFWSDAIHRVLLRRGCPCTAGREAECFRRLPPGEQAARLAGSDVSIEAFVAVIIEARRRLAIPG